MDPKDLFNSALEQATGVMASVKPEHFHNSTPCTDWDMHALVNHVLYELSWVPDLLDGKTVSEVGSKYDGDLVGNDVISRWNNAAEKAKESVKKANLKDTAHLSYADKTIGDYLEEIGTDLLVHSWDVAQARWCSLWFGQPVAEAVYARVSPRAEKYEKSSLFGKRVQVPDDAGTQVKLLAILGRALPTA